MSIITTIHIPLENLYIPVAETEFRTMANHAKTYGKTHYATVHDEETGILTKVSIARQYISEYYKDDLVCDPSVVEFNNSEFNYSFTLESEGKNKKPRSQYGIMTGSRSKEFIYNNGISSAKRVLENFLKKQAK